MNYIDTMMQALDLIEGEFPHLPEDRAYAAITALRLAIEQAEEQEPVAHLWQHGETGRTRIVMPDQIVTADADWFVVGPLYLGAAPPQRQPEQEPVAWRTFDGEGGYEYRTYEDNESYRDEYIARNGEKYASWVEPLYLAPPQRLPLTEEQIIRLWDGHVVPVFGKSGINPIVFARAIERAHGIGGGE